MTNEQRQAIESVMNDIEKLSTRVGGEPFDPKVEVMLEMAHALLAEQISLEKIYDAWDAPATRDDRFLNNSNIPTKEELEGMWEGE